MKRTLLISFLAIVVLSGCNKKKPEPVETPQVSDTTTTTPLYTCTPLPNPPSPFAWRDSTVDPNKNINTFMFNPANLNEIIIVVNGDITGYNKMYCYNAPAKKLTYLANINHFPPQINKAGWILYSTIENNIFKIKANGDSIKQLSTGYNTSDPKWDYTEKNYYFFQSAFINIPSQLKEADMSGKILKSKTTELPYTAVFRKSDKVIYLKVVESIVRLTLRDMTNDSEKDLISGPFDGKSPTVHFDNLTLDNNDENFYWSNSGGIFRCNLASLKIDTLFKNCENVKFDNPVIQFVKPNEVLFSLHITRAINAFQLFHEYKAIEYNIVTREMTELKVFP